MIDINPAADALPEHLWLLKAARTHGVAAAYAAHQEQLLTRHLLQTLQQWLATPTWTASRAFAAAHGGELLHRTTVAILDDLRRTRPRQPDARLHRGLLAYAATAGIRCRLRPGARHGPAAGDAHRPGDPPAVPAWRSPGCTADKRRRPEAHFQYAVETLRAIAAVLGTADATLPVGDITAALTGEAAAAVADCAANAAPWEQRDFGRRLAELADEHPQLAPQITELRDILSQ